MKQPTTNYITLHSDSVTQVIVKCKINIANCGDVKFLCY